MTKRPGIFAPRRASDIKLAGALFCFGGMEIILMLTLAEALYPGYSVHTNTISDLAAVGRSTALFFDPAIFVWGLSWLLGAYFLFRRSGRRRSMVLNMLPGAGVMLAALSPENVSLAVHSIGAIVAFIPGAIAMILSYRVIRSHLRYFALLLGLLSLTSVGIYFGAYYSPLVQQTLGSGGAERIIVYPIILWMIGLGSYLLALGEPNEGSQ
ncbi:MAG: DUF998 domain-containing protein [Thaumarchaeota archaeon]|nr:DUF998 domain-containing protein [Nitrososphaerota archaeon]